MAMGEGMQQVLPWSPGTWRGMVLRVSICLFAVASVSDMVTDFEFFSDSPAFWFMNTMMLLQIVWSLGVACVDIYAMRNRKVLHERGLVLLLVVGDGIMAFLTFTAVSASNSALTLYVGDVDFCRRVACGQIEHSILRAFIVWCLAATSFLSMLELLVFIF
ncbi:CASP-like protein 5B3 [Lolium perenne]|uniref:CASP-like protein 5B3 n=1 Tax=Lolium perenne TaxID=4522 RepID=UPI0021F55588|nr:CASP-like protein 5B3 [Lolium perenne]